MEWLEGVPTIVAQSISENLTIPTIGIGAGKYTDGQVLVIHDLIGMKSKEYIDAKFVKRYGEQYDATVKSLLEYKKDIESLTFQLKNIPTIWVLIFKIHLKREKEIKKFCHSTYLVLN